MKQQRNTRQRQLVLDAVRSRRDHPTADQIYQSVHAVDAHVSRGTVYRNLNLLCDKQEIFRVVMSDCDRFDLRTDPHYHMRCVACGRVEDVDSPYDQEYDLALAQKTGYQLLCHRLVVEGICPDCQKKKPLLTVGRARGKGPPPHSFHKIRQKPRFSRSGTFLLCKSTVKLKCAISPPLRGNRK